jgi:hypothetical protein
MPGIAEYLVLNKSARPAQTLCKGMATKPAVTVPAEEFVIIRMVFAIVSQAL